MHFNDFNFEFTCVCAELLQCIWWPTTVTILLRLCRIWVHIAHSFIHSKVYLLSFFPSNISFHSLYYYISLLSIYLSHTHTSTLKCIIIKFHTWTCLFIEVIPLIPSLSKPSFVPTLFMNPGLSTSVLLS